MVVEIHDAVVLLVSPDSVQTRSVCSAESDIALEYEKRLVSVLCQSVDTRTTVVRPAVVRLKVGALSGSDCFRRHLTWGGVRHRLADGFAELLTAQRAEGLWLETRRVAAGWRHAAVSMPLILAVPAGR